MAKFFAAILLILFAGALLLIFEGAANSSLTPKDAEAPALRIGNTYIPVEVLRSEAELTRGLSGRPSLAPEAGALFIFTQPDIYRFWMPDMHFPIDIIWISDGRKILGIDANVQPELNLANPRFYIPPMPAQYVLEVNAGFAASNNIKPGAPVIFLNIK